MIAVFNSSPLIFLSKLAFLNPALDLFDQIIKKLMEIKKIDVNIQQLHFNLKKIDFRVKDSIFLGIFRERT